MTDYLATAKEALASIREAGATFVITRWTTSYDAQTAEVANTIALQGSFHAVLLSASGNKANSAFQTGFDTGYAEDLRLGRVKSLLIAAAGAPFAPLPGDTVALTDGSWRLLGVTATDPTGDTPILYLVEVTQL